jgi:hypothetical protein
MRGDLNASGTSVPHGLKPTIILKFAARLKSCPFKTVDSDVAEWRVHATSFSSVPMGSMVIRIWSAWASVKVLGGTIPVPVIR